MSTLRSDLAQDATTLAWSLWTELGASSWHRTHQQWSVELEPLIAFTATIAHDDARLLREAIDWCAQNESLIAMHQLRHIVRHHEWATAEAIGSFGATVASRSGGRWPAAEDYAAYQVTVSHRSRLRRLDAPSLVQLRLRAIFGVGVRAEIMRVLLIHPRRAWSSSEIGSRIAATQRQVNNDLASMTLSGIVRREDGPGSTRYGLADPAAALQFVGPLPVVAPPWCAVFGALTVLRSMAQELEHPDMEAPETAAVKHVRSMATSLTALRIDPPSWPNPAEATASVVSWARRFSATLAAGDHSQLGPGTLSTPGQ